MGEFIPGEKVKIFLSIGSNVGDRKDNLGKGRKNLERKKFYCLL